MKTSGKMLTALGTGLAVGAVAGILLAPRKGQDTRKLISRKGKKLVTKINDEIRDTTRQITDLKVDLRDKVAEMGKKIDVFS